MAWWGVSCFRSDISNPWKAQTREDTEFSRRGQTQRRRLDTSLKQSERLQTRGNQHKATRKKARKKFWAEIQGYSIRRLGFVLKYQAFTGPLMRTRLKGIHSIQKQKRLRHLLHGETPDLKAVFQGSARAQIWARNNHKSRLRTRVEDKLGSACIVASRNQLLQMLCTLCFDLLALYKKVIKTGLVKHLYQLCLNSHWSTALFRLLESCWGRDNNSSEFFVEFWSERRAVRCARGK